MRDFLKLMRQYASPYKGHLAGAVVLNILSAVFNIFSFAILVPILNILFKVDSTVYEFIPWNSDLGFKDKVINNKTVGKIARALGCEPQDILLQEYGRNDKWTT